MKNSNSFIDTYVSKALLLSFLLLSFYGLKSSDATFGSSPKVNSVTELEQLVCKIQNLNELKRDASCGELLAHQLEINNLRAQAFNFSEERSMESAMDPMALCPEIESIELIGVAGFASTDRLVICGEPDTLAFVIFIEEPGEILGAQMSVSFQPGMQYAGFELTHYDGTTISNLNPDPIKPEFLLEGITDAIYIAYIGVEANCDADINGLEYRVDLEYNFTYQDTFGNIQNCRQKAEPARVYNSTIKQPIINYRSASNTTIGGLSEESCRTIQLSQDGIDAYLQEMEFAVCGIDLANELSLTQAYVNNIPITTSYSSADSVLSMTIDDNYFIGNSTPNPADNYFDENEKINITFCYEVTDCPLNNTQAITYKASWGCNDEYCQTVTTASEIRIRPNTNPEPFTTVEKLSNPSVCGEPGIIELTMHAVEKGSNIAIADSASGLFTNVTLGFETCDQSTLAVGNVIIGSTSLPSDHFSWDNGDLIVDFMALTMDPDGPGGLTDADGDGFFDDLPGGEQLSLRVELEFQCMPPIDGSSISCSSVDCSFAKFFVAANRDCGQSFKFFPEIEEFNIVNGATFVEIGETVLINNSFYGFNFGTVGNDGNCNPRADSYQTVEFCYIYEIENVNTCEAASNNELQVTFSGSPAAVYDIQIVPNSVELSVNGVTTATSQNGSFSDLDEDTRILNIPLGDPAVGQEVCYKYQLVADTALCIPPQYMAGTHQVLERCETEDCSCTLVKACDVAQFRIDPADCNCDCDISSGATLRRWNLGYTDATLSEKATLDDVPVEDLNRFLPCDTMYYEGWMSFNSDVSVSELYQWYFLANMTQLGYNGWGSDDLELMIDASGTELLQLEFVKQGSAIRQNMDMSQFSDCLNQDVSGSTGFFAYGSKTPWDDVIYSTPMCNSSYEFHDGNLFGIYFRNFNTLEDCREVERSDWEEGDCLSQVKDHFNIEVGDTIYMKWLLPLTKNVKAAARKIVEPDFEYELPQMINVASGHYIDEFDSDCLLSLTNCRENTPFNTFCPSDINAITNISIDDCGGEVVHEFNVINSTPINWYTNEYRPYFSMQDIVVPIYTPTMFCGNAVLVSESGVEYPLEVKSYENHDCVTVGLDDYCPVSSGDVGYVTFNLAENGYPGMGVGLGGYIDKFSIKYNLCRLCPAELADLSAYEIEYFYNTCETLDPSCFRCWLRADGSYNQMPSICSRDGSTEVGHNESYYSAFNLDTLFLFEGVSEDFNVNDVSNGFAALTQTPDRLLMASGEPGVSVEFNTIEVCADDADLTLETHKSVTGSITLTNSLALASVLDENGSPLGFNFVSSTGTTSTYSFPMDDLPPGVCMDVQIGTTLLYCPEEPEAAELCLTVTSGCLDRDILAAVVGNAAGCNEIKTCYEYVTEEANLQANFLLPDSKEYPLCGEIPVAALVKNVQIATLTDMALEFQLPLTGATIVPNSFMASYPNNGDLSGATPFYSIPDPMVNGNILSYPEDDDFSNHIHMNGFPGVLSSLDSNYITVKFLIKTDCDEFVSGSIATFEATAIDPCSPNTLSSGVVNSNQFIIEGGNPNDFAKVLVSAKPLQAYCGQSNAEFKVTGLNISEKPSGDSVQMCITLPEELTYIPGSMSYVIPASQSVGTETVTLIGTQTQVCFAGYNNMPVGGQFTLSFEANFQEDTPCGDYKVGVDIKELRPSEICEDGGTCDLFVQSSVNPDFTVELKGPLQTTRLQLTRSCDGGDDPVTMCYEADIENPGVDYSGTVTVNLHEDLTGNGVFDYFDPVIGSMDFPGTFVVENGAITLTGCFEVPLAKACPVILNIVFETECNCDNNVLPFTEIVPSFAVDLPSQIFLCPGEELALDTCSNYVITYDPASNVLERTTNDSLYIGLVDPSIATEMILTGISGDCSTYEPFTLEGIEALDLVLAETETCQDVPLTLELDLPSKYHDFVEVSWLPTTNLDDPTLLDPIFSSGVPGDYKYEVTLKISETCEIVNEFVLTVLPNGDLGIGGDDLFCFDYAPATLKSDPGYDYYEWYRLVGGFEIISASTPTNIWNGPIVAGDYIVKAFRSTDPCPSVSGIHTLNHKECVDLEFTKNVINIPDPFTLQSQVTYEMIICNVNDASIGMIFDETDIELIDQLPGGVDYVGHTQTTGSYSPGSNEWNIDIIENGTCDTLWIDVTVEEYGCIVNDAQITMAMHEDVDSTPNNEDGDQSEDDEDFAKVEVDTFDLALTKKLSPLQTVPVTIGSTVIYDIEICNQAEINAYNVEVVDYVPVGMSVDLSLNPLWSTGSIVTEYFSTILGPITPGNCEIIQMITTVDALPASGSYVNFAEINNAEDVNGNNPPDVDSEPDNDPANDGDFVDNDTSNTNDDEDDHDPADIPVVLVDCQIANNVPVCPENPMMLTEIGMDIVSWSWVGPNGFTSTSSSLTIDPPVEGIFKVTVTDSNGLTNECEVETIIHSEMDITGIVTDVSCEDGSDGEIDITIVGGSSPYGYDWSNDGPDAPDDDAQDITGLEEGTYSVTVQDANGCMKVLSFSVAEPSLLECGLKADHVLCNGEASGIIYAFARGGEGAYTYSLDGGPFQPGDTFKDLKAGEYTLIAKDENGCESTCSIELNEPEALTCLLDVSDDDSCTEDTGVIIAKAFSGTGAYQYSIDDGLNYQTSTLFVGLGAGAYVITVRDENDCISTCSATLVSPELPVCEINAVTNLSCSGGGDGVIVADGALGSGNYEFSMNGVDWKSSGTFTNLMAGTYTIQVRNQENPTCVNMCSATITEPVQMQCSLTAVDPTCNAEDNGRITVSVTGGQGNYDYSIDNGLTWQLSNLFTSLTANSYTVLVRDSGDDACVTSCDISLSEPDILTCDLDVQSLNCNGDNSGGIIVTASGGFGIYEYSLNGAAWQPGNMFMGLAAGSHNVLVRDLRGCQTTCMATISEPTLVTCSASGTDATDCNTNDGTISVSASGGVASYLYSLDGGTYAATSNFVNLMPGIHMISVQDGNGCTSTCEVEIGAPETPMCQITSVTHVTCFGASTGAVTVIGSDGNPPYEFSLDNANWQANGIFENLSAGMYNIYIRNDDNPMCTSMCAVQINEPEQLQALLTVNDPLCNGTRTGNITVIATEGTPGYEYSLNGGAWQPGHVFYGIGAGLQEVVVRDASNCTRTFSVTVQEPPALTCSSIGQDLRCNGDNSGSIDISGNGGTPPYDYSLNGGFWQDDNSFTDMPAGDYVINVRDANQCVAVCNITINEPPLLECELIDLIPESCSFNDGAIVVHGIGGTTPLSYSIDDGVTTQTSGLFDNLTPGEHTILITDANGCSVECTYEIVPDCYDLALDKTLITAGPYNYGDYIIFEIEVENQGNIDANNVELTEHIPCGFSYDPGRLINLSNDWTLYATAFPMTEISSLPAGESVTLSIEVQIEQCTDVDGYLNVAEISEDDGDDMDSDPDYDPNDDPEEDDHDTELVEVYDLALTKKIVTPGPYKYGDILEFEIELCNQAANPVMNVTISDYVPIGYSFDPGINANWSGSGPTPTTLTHQYISPLLYGAECVSIPLFLKLEMAGGTDDWKNVAEISEFEDEDGMVQEDVDSTPDNNPDNDGPMEDDVVDGANGDEDDSDFANPEIIDLALVKTTTATGPFQYGDVVIFDIEVFNQGNVALQNIVVNDFLSCGFMFNASNAPTWIFDSGTQIATTTLQAPIAAGASEIVQIEVSLIECPNAPTRAWTNVAEIESMENEDGEDVSDDDVDSDPDTDPSNDPTEDNTIDNSNGDEDDNDLETIDIYDLAQIKQLVTASPYAYGDILEYEICVINQGNLEANYIQLTDHLPEGLSIASAGNAGWDVRNAPAYTYDVNTTLMSGDTLCVSMFVNLEMTSGGADNYMNISEISADDGEDADSNADNDSDNDGDPVDDSYGDEEDDHDPENFDVVDIALVKTTNDVGPFSYGDIVTFDIEVFNQGNVDLYNVLVNDFIPCGYLYQGTNSPTWSFDAGAGVASANIVGPIMAGTSMQLSIQLMVQECPLSPLGAWTNVAEIESFENENGDDITEDDIDSDGDDDPTDDTVDDNTNDNSHGDEDDHDPEQIEVYDLAQIKQLITEGPFEYGDLIEYEICVINQGNVAANFIELTDHLPEGLSIASAGNQGWDATNAPAYVYTINELVGPSDTVCVTLFANIEMSTGGPDSYTNISEISEDDGEDADSNTDDDPNNDGEAVNDSYGDEEDDHDPESIEIFDLALVKKISNQTDPSTFKAGDLIEYEIEIFNQGNIDAYNVQVCDHIPAGFLYDPSMNVGWAGTAQTPTTVCTVILDPITAGTSITVILQMEILNLGIDGTHEDYTNYAEITYAEDGNGIEVEDFDSNPDNDPSNDDIVDDANNDPNDEDDHDSAMPQFMDLALKKQLAFDYTTVAPGDIVEYNITVFNQGTTDAYNVEITEYTPPGLTLSTNDTNDWLGAGPDYTNVIEGPIVIGDSVTVKMLMEVQTFMNDGDYTNSAEISNHEDESGNTPADYDSTPDDNDSNDGDMTDNEIDGANRDEDDSDFEDLVVVDLALVKTVKPIDAVVPGDDVCFTIEVFNQGNIPVSNVLINDYIPGGFLLSANDNNAWNNVSPSLATKLITTTINPLSSTTVEIVLTVQEGAGLSTLMNVAEIAGVEDTAGSDISDLDVDSNPDNDPDNDGDMEDNDVDGTNGDEDDSDPAWPPVFDLSLIKYTDHIDPVVVGDIITFKIEVCNQGNIAAQNILLHDYPNSGLALASTDSNGWYVDANGVISMLYAGVLGPDKCEEFEIDMEVILGASTTNVNNLAEIGGAHDEDGNDMSESDIDSTSDSDDSNDGDITDNDHNSTNGDEDDHDPSSLQTFDLALRKLVSQPGPYLLGDFVRFDIEVCNQGSMAASNVLVSDYIPSGLRLLDAPVNNAWTSVNPSLATRTFTGVLPPGECITIPIFLELIDVDPSSVINMAEITSATDMDGEDMSFSDIDSQADGSNSNDMGNDPFSDLNDINNQNSYTGGDEDDHDQAWILTCVQLACREDMNLSLDEDCAIAVTPSMVLTEVLYQDDDYEITVTNEAGAIVDSQFGQADINSTFNVSICVPFCVGNCCEVQITIEDKFAPVLDCNAGPFYVPCNAADHVPAPTATENCGTFDIVMIDEVEESYQCDTYTGKITRTFVGVDEQGNQSIVPCIQEIYITRPIMSNIQAPSTVSFGCGDDYITDVNGNPSPWNMETNMIASGLPIMCVPGMNTGIACHDGINPPLDGVYMMVGAQSTACNTLVTYEDVLMPTSGCKETIKRTFTVREWYCNMESTWTGVQFIDIINDQAPMIVCPTNFTVTTEYGCVGDVVLPAAVVSDPCGSEVTVNVQVEGVGMLGDDNYYPGAFLQSNGGPIQLPVGDNVIHYIATDGCYNSSTCTMVVTVQDDTEPVAICKSNITVSLPNSGTVEVWAATFGDDSFDECGSPLLEVTRLSSTCDPSDVTDWDDSVTFCCEDVGTDVLVVLRATDAGGNSNICMMAVAVQDKTFPVMTCPAPETITCLVSYDINNLTPQFGAPTIEDNCSGNNFTESVTEDINSCGVGTITRLFTVVNDAGLTVAACEQVITVELDEAMTDDDIAWPADESILNECSLAAAHPDFTGYPIYDNGLCDQIGYDYDDEVFSNVQGNNTCTKILRSWQVANWCQTDDNGNVIIWEHLQVIVVYNTVDPLITGSCSKIVQTSTDPNCGDVFVSATNSATDDCTSTSDLSWSWTIDIGLDNDSSNDISGTGPDASGTYPLGEHLIQWIVEDHCGNIDFCDQELSIVNTNSPVAVCLFGLSAELAPMDTNNDGTADTEMVVLSASQFDKESYHSCGYDLLLSFSANVNDNTISFACGQEGSQPISLWVTDENGNTSICNTFVNITNNVDEGFCTTFTNIVDVEGRIVTENDEKVDEVNVNLDGSNMSKMTDEDGGFAFPSMPAGGTYQVRPSKNDDLLNGVTTLDIILIQRHILQLEELSSPYQYVAADVNKSSSISAIDLIEIRKAILGITESYSNNESWRFVDARFKFDENQNPLDQNFEEEYDIPLLDGDMKTDFIGVKIGDVNGSVLANDFASIDVENRSSDGLVLRGTTAGQSILISTEQSTKLRGMQMTIQLNDDLLKVLSMNSGAIDLGPDSYHVNHDESYITLSWNVSEPKTIEAGEVLFSIDFDVEFDTNMLTIDSQKTKAEAYNENFEIMKIDYNTSQDLPELAVYQNEPNPWVTKTTIRYTLDKDQDVVFFFRSSEGKLLKKMNVSGTLGENTLAVDAVELGASSGVIYYELQTASDRIMKKMILVN